MKKFKIKTYDYKRNSRSHAKLVFQWYRGGDVEVTLIIVKGEQKHLSGFFAIAPTKKAAVAKLHEFCSHPSREYYTMEAREIVNLIPWSSIIERLEANEKANAYLQQIASIKTGNGTVR